ncbi:hypothetical protein NADFUDRAFT_40362 [Nadsonia fulvescens var. elongata DSM 6958]|uniref:Uncharacterized protein n=1 Tax=Nadsonia fulvescens var. elongata DSM 6958 TaxID=857566 RepID=A0A1E3PP27_9ASCO|nr:hypothetical protein NADFUDRAFT_40362 [Nadsonia fulvescens var. elongata DSM 6958]
MNSLVHDNENYVQDYGMNRSSSKTRESVSDLVGDGNISQDQRARIPPPLPVRPLSASSIQLSPGSLIHQYLSPITNQNSPYELLPSSQVSSIEQTGLSATLERPPLPARRLSVNSAAPPLPARPLSRGLNALSLPARPSTSPGPNSLDFSIESVSSSSFPPLVNEDDMPLSANDFWLQMHESLNDTTTPTGVISSPEDGRSISRIPRLPSLSPSVSLIDINDNLSSGGRDVMYDNQNTISSDLPHEKPNLTVVRENEGLPGIVPIIFEENGSVHSAGGSNTLPEYSTNLCDKVASVISEASTETLSEENTKVLSDKITKILSAELLPVEDFIIPEVLPCVDNRDTPTTEREVDPTSPISPIQGRTLAPELPRMSQSLDTTILLPHEIKDTTVKKMICGRESDKVDSSSSTSDTLINESISSVRELNYKSRESSEPRNDQFNTILLLLGFGVFVFSGGLLAFKTQIFKVVAILIVTFLCSFVSRVVWIQYNLDQKRVETELINREMVRQKALKTAGGVAIYEENWGGLVKENELVARKIEDGISLKRRIKNKVQQKIRNKIYEKLQSYSS